MIKNIFHNYKEGKLIGGFLSAKIDFVSFLTNNRYFFMNGNEKNSMNFASKYWKKKTRAENEIRDLKSGKSKLNNKDSKRVKRNLEDARRELRRSDLNILAAEKGLIHSKERYRQLEFELKSIESQLAARAKEPKSWVAEEIQKNRTLGEAAGVPAKYLDDMETCREEGGVISFYFAGFNETTGKYRGLISIDSEGNNRYFRMPQEDLVNMAREMSEAK